MGIRVHKNLGFLYTNPIEVNLSSLENITLKDLVDRSSLSSSDKGWLAADLYQVDTSLSLESLVRFIEPSPIEGFSYLFTPPQYLEKWKRYDDSIDYYEQEDGLGSVKYLAQRIYPYAEPIVVSETGQVVSRKIEIFSQMSVEEISTFEDFLKEELSSLGLDINKPLKAQLHMQPPLILRLVASHLQIKPWNLRPVILTYWS